MNRIAVIGGGAWGTALAAVTRSAGHEVTLWAREEDVVAGINETHENAPFLPGIALDPGIRATTGMADAAAGADAVLLVVPAQFMRDMVTRLAAEADIAAPVVICAKGIERGSNALMSEVVADVLPRATLAVMSGPTFATEVARGLPAAVTLADADQALGERLAHALAGERFRPYWSDDMIGAQIGGAVKNVLAIACGIVVGRGLGESARAALITRGLAEMTRLGTALGARMETLMGLSGLGDLTLTCGSERSRNMSLGLALGRGERLDDILAGRRAVTEGVASAVSVVSLAERHGVEMPISAAVKAVLHDGADIGASIDRLMARPLKPEPLAS